MPATGGAVGTTYVSSETMRIGILKDTLIQPVRTYDADDAAGVFSQRGMKFGFLSLEDCASLRRSEHDVLVIPYEDGEIEPRALASIRSFHGDGGSLLFLGDLPHVGRWYPMKNMQAEDFHLTRCHDSFRAHESDLLTDFGRQLLSEVDDPGWFAGRKMPALRIKAFPPDVCRPVFRGEADQGAGPIYSVVAIERRCERFLGARSAVVGFNSGEPRESVDGSYLFDWTYDAGLLNREWNGIDRLVASLAAWLEPVRFSVVVDPGRTVVPPQSICSPAGRMDAAATVLVEVRGAALPGSDLPSGGLRVAVDGKPVGSPLVWDGSGARPRAYGSFELSLGSGVHNVEVYPDEAPAGSSHSAAAALDSSLIRVLESGTEPAAGYGFSTFHSFRTGHVTDEYRYLCREMVKRGCRYLRANVPWEDVEPAPGVFDWDVPDELVHLADDVGLKLQFWMFPTTRGSGLSDGGIPRWILKEPAIDRTGKPGNFPSLFSPYYREHYFGMVDRFTRRYAEEPLLDRFVLDFGNSDFPYGYFYYYNDPSLFDYSEWERRAFARYLRERRMYSLRTLSTLFGRQITDWDSVSVPLPPDSPSPASPGVYDEYLEFRTWAIQDGIRELRDICMQNAPTKVPADLPGHGSGSICDLTSAALESKARHWVEEKKYFRDFTMLHNAGPTWGGEPWQVGGTYEEYDFHLYNSLRHNAAYLTIPGPDLGVDGEEIARVGYIRSSIMGAVRDDPRIAVLDRLDWRDPESLAPICARLDQEVDFITSRHRYDFSCYDLLILPARMETSKTVTGGGVGAILPRDEHWYWLLRESIERGLCVLLFPQTANQPAGPGVRFNVRSILSIDDVSYGPRRERRVDYPASFGGGSALGMASGVRSDGEVILFDTDGTPILVRRRLGAGSILLAGFDSRSDSFDGAVWKSAYERRTGGSRQNGRGAGPTARAHTISRLCAHLGLRPTRVDSGQLFVCKSLVARGNRSFFIAYSDLPEPVEADVAIRLPEHGAPELAGPADRTNRGVGEALPADAAQAVDLANEETFVLSRHKEDWYRLRMTLAPNVGRYLRILR